MLILSLVLLGVALLLGAALAILHMRVEGAAAPPLPFAALHGLLAIAGYGVLILALQGPQRGLATGTASFGRIAAVMLTLAAVAGIGILAAHLRRGRLPGTLIGIHAMLAVGGFVVLAAYIVES